MWYTPSSCVTPLPKTLGCLLISCSLVTGCVTFSVYTAESPVCARTAHHCQDRPQFSCQYRFSCLKILVLLTSLQSKLKRHLKSPRHTRRSIVPTMGSMAPLYVVIWTDTGPLPSCQCNGASVKLKSGGPPGPAVVVEVSW